MKLKTKNILLWILILALFCVATLVVASVSNGFSGHVVLFSGSSLDRIAVVDRNGEVIWEMPQSDISWVEVNDADLLPNGNIVFAARKNNGSVVYMVRPNYPDTTGYEILWTYQIPSGAENHTAQALPDGGVLIGEAYNTYIRIVELDAYGNLRKTLGGASAPLPSWPSVTGSHNQIRQIHKTKEGTYLVACMGAQKTLEYSASGKKLAEYPEGGFTAVEDNNGNVIVSGGSSCRITCFKKDGSKLWQITQNDLSGISLSFVAAVDVLDNGNIVFANWGGHGGASGNAVMEITPPSADKPTDIVWSLNSGSNTSNVQILDNIDQAVFEGVKNEDRFDVITNRYRSPVDVVGSALSGLVYVADATNNSVEMIRDNTGILIDEIVVSQRPNALLLSPDGAYLYVATGGSQGRVEVYNAVNKLPLGSVSVGHTPSALALSEDGETLYVANRFDGTVQSIPLKNGKIEEGTTAGNGYYVTREPMSLALREDKLYVGGHLPTGNMTDDTVSCEIAVVNVKSMTVQKVITMVSGSTNLKDIALSPDGEFLYVSHALGRWNVATTHVDRGWIYTNAITEIRTSDDSVRATMLVDDLDLGAANPWGIDVSQDKIVLSIAGTKELMILDRMGLREKIEKVYSGQIGGNGFLTTPDDIPQDLTFTTAFKQRICLGEDGPRGIELMGNRIYVANYYGGSVSIYDMKTASLATVKLATDKAEDAIRGGERLWNDATICLGQWQSCASCHPDARVDALNWDNMNDGMGTPKQARSMVGAWERGRVMSTGIRENAKVANRAGVKYICFNEGMPESELEKIDAYVMSLMAEESPYLENGQLSESALRGKALFEGKANCASCHTRKLYGSDVLIYENYVQSTTETRGLLVPPLVEAWRTAPYLHDGSASTIMDVLTVRNLTGTHGNLEGLSESELQDICNFVLSIGTDIINEDSEDDESTATEESLTEEITTERIETENSTNVGTDTDDSAESSSNEPNAGDKVDGNNGNGLLIAIVIGAVAIVIIGVVAIVLVRKRRK